MNERIKIESDPLYLSQHTHSLGCMSERETAAVKEIIFMFSSFTFGADSITEEVTGFSPLWFPQGKILCVSCLLCFIAVHVILLVKDPKIIMLSLNDKNLTNPYMYDLLFPYSINS